MVMASALWWLVLVVLSSSHMVLGRAAEQRKYRTAYACEGSTLQLSCENSEVINLVRANYGRFSITICNEHGDTDWSVNCMSHRSLRVLHSKCNQQSNCSILASTTVFGDPCPGTLKYLEAHYQCVPATPTSSTSRPRPPWFSSVGPALWSTARPDLENSTTTSTTTATTIVTESTTSVAATTTLATLAKSPVGDDQQEATGEEIGRSVNHTTTTVPAKTTSTTSAPPLLHEENSVTVPVPDVMGQRGMAVGPHNKWFDRDRDQQNPTTSTTTTLAPSVVEQDHGLEVDSEPVTSPPSSTTRRPAYPSFEGKLPLIPPSDDASYCPPTVTRGLYWNWTRAGDMVVQPCPGGATGYARWRCAGPGYGALRSSARSNSEDRPSAATGPSPAAWLPAAPDLSECKSVWLTSLESRIGEGDSLISIANDLAQVTASKTLYGGDMKAATRLLHQMARKMSEDLQAFPDWRQREAIVTELVQSLMRAGSSLLEPSQSLAWRDLGLATESHASMAGYREQPARATATDLLTGLEENAFLLASTITRQKSTMQSMKNILMSVRVLESRQLSETSFPGPEEWEVWGPSDDVITLPAEALLDNSEGGLVRVVLFAYNNLEDILSPLEEGRYPQGSGTLSFPMRDREAWEKWSSGNSTRIVNSRVLSASLGKGRHIQLPQPVTLTLKHLRQDNVSNPSCVFWDYTVSAWSDEGCRVVHTNRSHTTCKCDHLTNFALLMDLHSTVLSPGQEAALSLITYVGCAISILCLFLAILTFQCFRGLKSDRTTIHKNLCVCLLIAEIIFLAGIQQTHQPILCGIVAGLLHFFFLCAFMWMFLEGFQLYVMLVEVFETEKSRVKWYYLFAYGLPTLIVAISCVVDPFSYGTERYCWLRTDNYFIFAFVGPVVLILLANVVFLFMAIYMMCRHRSANAVMKTKEQTRLASASCGKTDALLSKLAYHVSWLRGAFVLMFLLGLTWTFGLLYINQATVVMAYIFTILNSLQGLFIFFFHCIQNDKVRKEYRKVVRQHTWLQACLRATHLNAPDSKERSSSLYNATPSCPHSDSTSSTGASHAPNNYLVRSWSGPGTGTTTGMGSLRSSAGPTGNALATAQALALGHGQTLPIAHPQPHALHTQGSLRGTGAHTLPHTDNENVSFKSYGHDAGHVGSEQEDFPRSAAFASGSHSQRASPFHPQGFGGSMGRRAFPHSAPNPALSQNAALDAQLVAQFVRDNEAAATASKLYPHLHKASKRLRAGSPWNHTYTEIDLRYRTAPMTAMNPTLREDSETCDPVYEEIERSANSDCLYGHCAQHSDLSDEDNRRPNSDVSRQSSRSYGDHRPLIPYNQQQANNSNNRDLLTTISCAFSSPHLKARHRDRHGQLLTPQQQQQQYPATDQLPAAYTEQLLLPINDGSLAVAVLNGDRVLCQVQPNVSMGGVNVDELERTLSSHEQRGKGHISFTEC